MTSRRYQMRVKDCIITIYVQPFLNDQLTVLNVLLCIIQD